MERIKERGQATRGGLIEAAGSLFADQGYELTSIEAVLLRTGVSRGALYHHFSSKQALFTAVLEAQEVRIAATVLAAAQGASNPLYALRAGCAAWLRIATDPVVRRVVLIDAPTVVGWQTWREIDGRHGLGLLRAALSAAAAAGRVRADMVDAYAHMLLAVLIEMALLIARAEDAEAATHTAHEVVERLLSSVLDVRPGGAW